MTTNYRVSAARQAIRNFSTSLLFTGSGQAVNLGTANPFTGNFYFSTWFYWNGTNGNWQQIFNKRDSYTLAGLLFSMSFHTSSSVLVVDTIAGSITTTLTPTARVWSHLIWCHNVTGNTDDFYLNGRLNTSTAKRNLGNGTGALITIGACHSPPVESFNGYLDETAIGLTALTTAQAMSIYQSSVYPAGSLWTLLKYNEGSGTTVNDSSGNGNTGTIVSATYETNLPPHSGTRILI